MDAGALDVFTGRSIGVKPSRGEELSFGSIPGQFHNSYPRKEPGRNA